MTDILLDITSYIPHRGKMLLLDKLVYADEEQAISTVLIKPSSLFFTHKGIPALVGIEYMAQTIAAYSGAMAFSEEYKPKIGLLLGSRRYDSSVDYFLSGDSLQITVKPIYQEEESSLGVFSCQIDCNGKVYATAKLNVFQPESIEEYFEDKIK